ncbi:2Fe-2S iron-sulfur cluster binding domain-containing protein 2 [Brevibacillus borstelensis AK1]|uniref:2Fe-2S iron-sulfur cluster binding domain-containing protein 2 n=1 Tax=Brevibacillus borstelensis AK1 TaxID=1300222 RepID=M8E0W7_9BACL|nr:2Fe-2S iron-sulfur cluster-binding protein [Brevibacillus borstelensis]EMT52936.1 2Fe-2S iron-sulfur cluster binding domain-containing protein 2 [Brevibacillus borstelensis AK1]
MDQSGCVTVTVVQGEERSHLSVRTGGNLLLAMVRERFPVDFACTTGKCATCRLRMEIPPGSASEPSPTERYRLGADFAAGLRLSCQVYVTGPLTVYLPTSG